MRWRPAAEPRTRGSLRRRRRLPGWFVPDGNGAGERAMSAVVAALTLHDLGQSVREAFFMFWETLWALVLGFTLSGVVQAFVSKAQMQRVMGGPRPASV